MTFSNLIDQLGDWNPQLFRELKGQYHTRNITLAVLFSVIGQMLVFLVFKSKLPAFEPHRQFMNRYCVGTPPNGWNGYPEVQIDTYCTPNLGHLMINWSLWWLDIFMTLSIIGIVGLLVIGTYLLIADLSKEENRGTLNFIRLSPQSVRSLFVGKLLGVPSLVYFAALLGLPFHLIAGLKAGISPLLIIAFYGVVVASCVFFFNAALLLGLVSAKLGGLQAFVISGSLLFFLFVMTIMTLSGHYIQATPFDWLALFYPGTVLTYLAEATFIAPQLIRYLPINDLKELHWYGQGWWQNVGVGMGFMIAHFVLWSYWITQGLKRRFRNPSSTLLTKSQSYGLSLCFIFLLLGFTLQTTDDYDLSQNMQMLQAWVGVFMIILIAALSPHRQTLQDWARYRHQFKETRKSLIQDLLFGEKSPSILAIAVNLGLMIIYLLPSLFFFSEGRYQLQTLTGLLLGSNTLLIFAVAGQWLLMQKSPKRVIWAIVTVSSLMIAPLIVFAILGLNPNAAPNLWLSTFIPLVAIQDTGLIAISLSLLGQWTIMVLGSVMMTKQLRHAGESEVKRLLSA